MWSMIRTRRQHARQEVDRELAFHIDQLTQDNMAQGMTAAEARRHALILFGGPEQIKQQVHEVHLSVLREGLAQHLRSAFRLIRRESAFASVVILMLALGIGANSAVFSAVDAILLRPLPFPHASELVRLHELDIKTQNSEVLVAPPRLIDWDHLNSTFQAISGYYTEDATLETGDIPEKLTLALVAPKFLQVWGVAPAIGRDFTEQELHFGGPNAILVSDRFWRGHLHADPSVVGHLLKLSKISYTVVGVMPADFLFPNREIDLWSPQAPDAPYAQSRESTWFTVFGRLAPGMSIDRARADLASVQAQLGRQFAKTDAGLTVTLEPLQKSIVGDAGAPLWLLYGSVSLLLLIACTNIAGLLMARTAEREYEISIRYSLGATRSTIIGQLLTEVLLLAVVGSLLGLALAAVASRIFTRYASALPRVGEIALNGRVVAYSLACAVLVSLLCGLIPAVRGTRRTLSASLGRAGRGQVSTRAAGQWLLVGVQVSLTVALLIASGLMLRSFQALQKVDPGFDSANVLTLRVSGGWGETAAMEKLKHRIDRTLDELRALPGVEAAATSGTIPGNAVSYPSQLRLVEGSLRDDRKLVADVHYVSTGYFNVLHIPLLQGSACADDLPASSVVVSRSFATKYFAGTPLLGHHLQLLPAADFSFQGEVRGIVGDAREQGLDTAPQPSIYWCTSASGPDPHYLIRTHGDPMVMVPTILHAIHGLEPSRSIFEVMPLVDHLDARRAESNLRTSLITTFAFVAILLVSVGLYGTIAYIGKTRRREIGLRLALGASPAQIVATTLSRGLLVALAGGIAGLLLAATLSQLLRGLLFGISPLDVATYASALGVALLVAAVASLPPAIRATRVALVEVLREN